MRNRLRAVNQLVAPKVNITEEDILKTYPWDYQMLTDKLKSRYLDFIANAKYHENRKRITLANAKFKMTRYLDPSKNSGLRKEFYNPNIIAEFDKVYTLKK